MTPLSKIAGSFAALAILLGHAAPAAAQPDQPSGSAVHGTAAGHEQPKPQRLVWSFAGAFGVYDKMQLRRGFQVYKEVCASCHSMKRVAFRNLSDPGGPRFSDEEVKALAESYRVKDGPNDKGEMYERPGRPSDYFPSPFANEQAARAAFSGAYPPDMSALAKARGYSAGFPTFLLDALPGLSYQEHGVDYMVALLGGYAEAPAGFTLGDGQYYNLYMHGNRIAMPPPLADGQVTYADGSPETAAHYAKDVAAFLMWAAEPRLEERKAIGLWVVSFLLVFAGLVYIAKRRIWAKIPH